MAKRAGTAERIKRLAERPDRPGEKCKAAPAAYTPQINRGRCEGKADCVEVCPYDVFEVRRIDDADFAALGLLGKLKNLAHGRKSAYTPGAARCLRPLRQNAGTASSTPTSTPAALSATSSATRRRKESPGRSGRSWCRGRGPFDNAVESAR